MPELPEVEAVRRHLVAAVEGRRIESVRVLRTDYIRYTGFPPAELSGRELRTINRHGKRLFWRFVPQGCMVSHLGMSGRVTLRSPGDPSLAHTHLIIAIAGGIYLHFSDPRRFGGVWLYESEVDAAAAHVYRKMGVDALSLREEDLTVWSRKATRLKAELLSQKTVAGLGNIYVDEALWMARLHPMQKVRRLTCESRRRLVACIGQVLRASLRHGGTTFRDYRDAKANRGGFAQRLAVYGKAGHPCQRCGAVLQSLVIAQRSTVICPKCQLRRNHGRNAN